MEHPEATAGLTMGSAPIAEELSSAEEPRRRASDWGFFGDVLLLVFAPGRLFSRLPIVNRSGTALAVLLVAQFLYSLAIVQSGVLDYEVDAATQKQIGREYREAEGSESEDGLTSALNKLEKNASFMKLLAKVSLFTGEPARLLAGLFATSGVFFAVVAMRGGKPNFSVLFGVASFAALVEIPRMALWMALFAKAQSTSVDLTAAAFLTPGPNVDFGQFLLLRRADPFEWWFWLLVFIGVWKTGQLSGPAAFVTTAFLAAVSFCVHFSADVVRFAEMPKMDPTEPV